MAKITERDFCGNSCKDLFIQQASKAVGIDDPPGRINGVRSYDQAAPRNCPINNAYPRVRGLRMGVDNLRQNLEGVRKFLFISNDEESVTGQRSNQLNYVPSLFSWVCGKPLIFLSFLTVHSVACFIHVHPV